MQMVTFVELKGMHYAALAGLLSLTLLTSATATDLPGRLQGVSITDAQVTNSPPTATFTYKQDGNTITLDASGSFDADGNIIKYQWDFGDGTTREGITTTYTLTDAANIQVTLTVVDNNNGVALIPQTITPTPRGITDDFSKDTSINYIKAYGTGTLAIADGYVHLSTNFSGRNVFYHSTSLGSADQHIEYNVEMASTNDQAGVAFRIDTSKQTAYVAYFDPSLARLIIRGLDLSTGSWAGSLLSSANAYSQGPHLVTITIAGNSITAKVDGVTAISGTQSIYTTGNFAGVVFYRGLGDSKIFEFKARAN